MIIDAHAHIAPLDYASAEIYIQTLEEAGIDKGIVVPGGTMDVRRMTDYIIGKASPENPIPNNQYLWESCKKYPQLLSFSCVDPHKPDALNVLKEGFQQGSRGLKLSPMTHQFSFAGKGLASLVECCDEYGFPVYSHVVYSPGAATAKFIALARSFPGVNFIIGHMGFGPADREAREAAASMDNVFLESSTGNYLALKEAVQMAGADKIIFGSEFPLSHPGVELKKIMLLDLSDDARDKILGINIRQLIKLSS